MSGATQQAPILNDTQLKEAVTLFAQGMTRQEVISHLIDNSERLQNLEVNETNFRNKMSDLLRSADPTSTRFAVTLYGEHYNLHKDAIKKVLENRYEITITRSIEFMSEEVRKLAEQVDELDHMIETASNTKPIGTSEFLATINVRNNAAKRMQELQDKMLERLERAKLASEAL